MWPVHGGRTSGCAWGVWVVYAMHLYWLHRSIAHRGIVLGKDYITRSMMLALDAMCAEYLANLFAIFCFHTYYFFYFRDDLNHFTTIEILPLYFITGLWVCPTLDLLLKIPDRLKPALAALFWLVGVCLVVGPGLYYGLHQCAEHGWWREGCHLLYYVHAE